MAFSSLKHLQHMYTRIINASVFLTWIGIISAKLLIFSSISPSRYQSIFSGTDRDAGAPAKKSGFRRISAAQFPSQAFFFLRLRIGPLQPQATTKTFGNSSHPV
ncbi:hypothetical protein M441DRAFT_437764 [Trichoderma asperellum CBS 433.97]|uniref:Uncharacterized protein n=1 Tax=Trichoderma asperellum (strain ATCC 204424 / CBS 433.97 / NBRC 101777) TaxID=1042311 RepID=A0A2T3Z3N5_TRIA4|nr:hypothetical protein M441DRAFT_437764 [Trichoderma asperellum CBS 433.97]PTB39412.1 hypothetical protein M441DRAFT_437764 [Trichoderma asperellum CBS 433.97]